MNVIGIKDLYEAWENMYQNNVDDYITPNVIIYINVIISILGREGASNEGRLDHSTPKGALHAVKQTQVRARQRSQVADRNATRVSYIS